MQYFPVSVFQGFIVLVIAHVDLLRLNEAVWAIHISCWWSHAQAYWVFFFFSHQLYSVLFSFNCGSCCPLYLKKNYEFAVSSFLSVAHHHLLLRIKLPAGVTQSEAGATHCRQADPYLLSAGFLLALVFVFLPGRLLLLLYLIICLVSTWGLVSHWSFPTQTSWRADR